MSGWLLSAADESSGTEVQPVRIGLEITGVAKVAQAFGDSQETKLFASFATTDLDRYYQD